MKKVFSLLVIMLLSLALWACSPKVDIPVEDDIPLIPLEPSIPNEDEEEVDYLLILDDSGDLVRNEFKGVTLDVSKFNEVKITIIRESNYDIPVNFNNFKVDGESVDYTGVEGTSYVQDHDFKIGSLNAIAHLVNTHGEDLRLHTVHHTLTNPHSIIIDVSGINELYLEYRVTTEAVKYIDALSLELSK